MIEYLKLFMPPDRERVAFVIQIGDRMELWPTTNAWRGDRRANYTFTTQARRAAQARARDMGGEVVGHAHSHVIPGCHQPSTQDLAFIRPGEVGILFDLPDCQIITYDHRGVLAREVFRMPRKYASFWPLLANGQG